MNGDMSSSNDKKKQGPLSSIRQEYKRLQDVESLLNDIWNCEIQAYEQDHGNGNAALLDTSATSSHGGYRNNPNVDGVITDPTIFPYHSSFYPLLDCYDSINHNESAGVYNLDAVPPSEAPNPFTRNGHRRSKFSPRLDPQGVHIEELEFLEGHLPNSASAILQTLMPQARREEYGHFLDGNEEDGNISETLERPDENASDLIRPRFWKLLMNNDSKLSSSNVSLAPEDEEYEYDTEDIADEIQKAQNARGFSFLTWWEHRIMSNETILIDLDSKVAEYSVECLLATSPQDVNLVLLRLLKHAMSDLQRDFKLARAILLLIADLEIIDKYSTTTQSEPGDAIETLRRLLIILSSEYIYCSGSCHEYYLSHGGINHVAPNNANGIVAHIVDSDASIDLEGTSDEDSDDGLVRNNRLTLNDSEALDPPTHYCSDWFDFLGTFSTVIAHGIKFMTRQHASVICAFVLKEIDYMVGVFNNFPDRNDDSTAIHYNDHLKQNLYMLKNSEMEEEPRLPPESRQLKVYLIVAIVNGLKKHAIVNRLRTEKQMQGLNGQSDSKQDSIQQSMSSFIICVEAIVDIGERIMLKLLPNHGNCLLGGVVARALLEVHLKSDILDTIDHDQIYVAQNGNPHLRSMIDPYRYANAISNAFANPHLGPSRRSSRTTNDGTLNDMKVMEQRPTQEVQDVVRALFLRDLIDIRASGFGWGDWCIWLGLPLSPEPLLFSHHKNYPISDSGEVWMMDEEGEFLDSKDLVARYEFTLMVLLREWNKPWSPGSNLSFSIPFRSAIRELALCAHRYGVPSDIVETVNSFLPRLWWRDERSVCWFTDCQLKCMHDHFQSKIISRQSNWIDRESAFTPHAIDSRSKAHPLVTCKCGVVLACSKEHIGFIHQEGHARCCGLPPYRPLSGEDIAFIRDILDETAGQLEGVSNSNDDEDDWESVNSDEEFLEDKTMSQKIRKYFEENSFRHVRRERLPFEDFF